MTTFQDSRASWSTWMGITQGLSPVTSSSRLCFLSVVFKWAGRPQAHTGCPLQARTALDLFICVHGGIPWHFIENAAVFSFNTVSLLFLTALSTLELKHPSSSWPSQFFFFHHREGRTTFNLWGCQVTPYVLFGTIPQWQISDPRFKHLWL